MIKTHLLQSTALLFTFAFAVSLIRDRVVHRFSKWNAEFVGLTYAAIAAYGMTAPLIITEGVRYDARTSFIGLAGLCYGPRAALIATSLPFIYRISLGGHGVWPGVASILSGAALGICFFRYFTKRGRNPKLSELFILGAIFGIGALVWALFLPADIRNHIVYKNGLSILGIHILATVIFGAFEIEIKRSQNNADQAANRQRLLATAEDVGQIGFAFVDIKTGYVRHSESLAKMQGFPIGTVMPGEELVQYVHPEDRDYVAKNLAHDFPAIGKEIMFRFRPTDGPEKIFSSRQLGIRTESGRKEMIYLVQDFTEKSSLLEQVSHSARLATIGETASRIAHEIVNPLTAAKLMNERSRDQIEMRFPEATDILQMTERVDDRLDSILHLVRSISRFARAKPEILSPHSIHESISKVIELFREIGSRSRLEIKLDLQAKNDVVNASPLHMQQILLNLLTNANHATAASPYPTVQISTINEGEYLLVKVSDNGIGIPELDQGKIFEPFFTTKDKGHGTGLGLSVTRSLVSNMQGTISLQSSPNHGAEFTLRFPIVQISQ